jgi:hypothetical protein
MSDISVGDMVYIAVFEYEELILFEVCIIVGERFDITLRVLSPGFLFQPARTHCRKLPSSKPSRLTDSYDRHDINHRWTDARELLIISNDRSIEYMQAKNHNNSYSQVNCSKASGSTYYVVFHACGRDIRKDEVNRAYTGV